MVLESVLMVLPSAHLCPASDFLPWASGHLLHFPDSIRVLMLGDVVGKPGRKLVTAHLPKLREALKLDFVTMNGENLAGGFGISEKTFAECVNAGVDCVTMGNHWSDKPEVHKIRAADKRLVLPQNLKDLEGVKRIPEFEVRGRTISVLNLLGLFAMKHEYDNPFNFLFELRPQLKERTASGMHILLADVHAEASSEKQAISWFLDGILAGLIGTHTHTPTSDERVTAKGTAFITDVGMTGPYRSVIGMDIERSLKRHFPPAEKKAQEVADHDAWLCAFLLEISPKDGLTLAAHRLQYRAGTETWASSSVGRQPN